MILVALTSSALAGPFDGDTLSVNAASLAMPDDVVLGIGGRLQSDHMPYVSFDGRANREGDWQGYATAGLDFCGSCEGVDIDLGLAIGGFGDWRDRAVAAQPGFGIDWGFGVEIWRLGFNWHSVHGLDEELGHGFDNRRTRVSFDIVENAEIFVQSSSFYLNEDDLDIAHAYGLGAELTF